MRDITCTELSEDQFDSPQSKRHFIYASEVIMLAILFLYLEVMSIRISLSKKKSHTDWLRLFNKTNKTREFIKKYVDLSSNYY